MHVVKTYNTISEILSFKYCNFNYKQIYLKIDTIYIIAKQLNNSACKLYYQR